MTTTSTTTTTTSATTTTTSTTSTTTSTTSTATSTTATTTTTTTPMIAGSSLPKKCLILIWCQEKMELKIPEHKLCGGGCEITRNHSRFDEAAAVVIEMKWTEVVKTLPSIKQK